MKFNQGTGQRFEQDHKFIYRINEDLKNQLEQTGSSGTTEDPKQAVREGRLQVHTVFQDFNNEAIQAAEAGQQLEGKAAERLANDTRERVFRVLDGRAAGSRSITQALGVSNRYHAFISSIENNSVETENTIADAEFALSALSSLSKNLDTRVQAEQQRTHGYRNGFMKFFSQMNAADDKKLFAARAQIVSRALSNVEGEIEGRKTETESRFDEIAARAEKEFGLMPPQEKAQFLTEVQQEIASGTPPTGSLQQVYVDSIMEGLTVHQRIEVYKKTSFDSTQANRNLEACADGDQHIRDKYTANRNFFESESTALNFTTLQNNLGLDMSKVNPADVINDKAFLDEFQAALDQSGSQVLNSPFFQGYDQNSTLTNEQRFTGYLRIIQQTPAPAQSLSVELKKKIASGLKWIEQQEAIDDNDIIGFSSEFIDTENSLYQSTDAFRSLLVNLNTGRQNLNQGNTKSVGINQFLGQAQSSLAKFEQDKEHFSPSELEDLEKYRSELEKMITAAEKMLTVLEAANNTYKEKEKEFTKLTDAQTDLQTRIGQLNSQANIQAIGGGANNPAVPVNTNQAENDLWKRLNDQLTQTQQDLGQVKVDLGLTGTNTPSLANMPFSFMNAEVQALMHQIEAQFSTWTHDRTTLRPRQALNSPNNADEALRKYLKRAANKTLNQGLENELEANRKKAVEYLVTKPLGSAIALQYKELDVESSDLATQNLNTQNAQTVTGCIMIAKTKTGATLYQPGNPGSLLFVQIGVESQKAEIISVPAPSNTNIAADGLPKGYDIGVRQNFVATPLSITAA